ncbi:uncharacterized protein Z518_04629 [Rhinocladiella mackenziei CBS 650.93]|uniref:Acyl-CoA dehydrogenase n=1 Tax=Rhinocladiella mackenziei CBS 650.93 TaxID=1442369 RepID=A0A0D2H897_9EURO|nr:uncharacterized protein Z518_04629 [Rhinocladiella mackenziei CBS 650.93]KIX06653.1 hypothetical protein Z518_04629 [Rhinocladiella mackenziei CBS 650.93]
MFGPRGWSKAQSRLWSYGCRRTYIPYNLRHSARWIPRNGVPGQARPWEVCAISEGKSKFENLDVPRKKLHHHVLLLRPPGDHVPASKRVPAIARPFVSQRALETLDLVEKFVEERCVPADRVYAQQLGTSTQSRLAAHPAILEDLKTEARRLGLWNMFLPKAHYAEGAGFSNLEFGLMEEYLGKSVVASEATNCAAPDTGNMEVLAKYGTEARKKQWLRPLLEGEIRSAFLMTEPNVASSDATNIQFSIRRDGDSYILDGQKWWSSGAPDPRCKLYILMGKSDPNNPSPYRQQTVVLVPSDAPRHHHHENAFENVRVPASNVVLGEGRGFEVIQGRLGPGRIHHAMRSIGNAERALEYFVARITDPSKKPFGKQLSEHGVMLERVARSRVEIDAARLAVLNAAIIIDESNAKGALREISMVKIQTPQVVLDVADRAVQAFGAAGVCQDTPLPEIWTAGRAMRIVNGPDEVHLLQLGRNESKRGPLMLEKVASQEQTAAAMLARYGLVPEDSLQMNLVRSAATRLARL